MYKKRRNWGPYVALLMITILLYGCGGTDKKGLPTNKAQDKLISMEGYACIAQVTHIDIDKKNTYEVQQIYQTDGKYRTEITKPVNITGVITIFDGEKILQHNPHTGEPKVVELRPNAFRNQMFLGTFVHNYLQSEGVVLESEDLNQRSTTVLEAVIPGGSIYMASQKLWIDETTYKPIRMAIYDKDNKETVVIEFTEFTYNPEIKQGAFSLE